MEIILIFLFLWFCMFGFGLVFVLLFYKVEIQCLAFIFITEGTINIYNRKLINDLSKYV